MQKAAQAALELACSQSAAWPQAAGQSAGGAWSQRQPTAAPVAALGPESYWTAPYAPAPVDTPGAWNSLWQQQGQWADYQSKPCTVWSRPSLLCPAPFQDTSLYCPWSLGASDPWSAAAHPEARRLRFVSSAPPARSYASAHGHGDPTWSDDEVPPGFEPAEPAVSANGQQASLPQLAPQQRPQAADVPKEARAFASTQPAPSSSDTGISAQCRLLQGARLVSYTVTDDSAAEEDDQEVSSPPQQEQGAAASAHAAQQGAAEPGSVQIEPSTSMLGQAGIARPQFALLQQAESSGGPADSDAATCSLRQGGGESGAVAGTLQSPVASSGRASQARSSSHARRRLGLSSGTSQAEGNNGRVQQEEVQQPATLPASQPSQLALPAATSSAGDGSRQSAGAAAAALATALAGSVSPRGLPCSLHPALPLAVGRAKRVPGGNPLQDHSVAKLVKMLRGNSTEFQAQGRVLRLKNYLRADARPPVIDAVLDALEANRRVEALYIQNFEWGMLDPQLAHLTEVLKKGHIWALNVGENLQVSLPAWERFTEELPHTAVAYMYVSEHHLLRTNLKERMRDLIRVNRRRAPKRDPAVIACIKNMWWNPKLPRPASAPPSRPPAAANLAGAANVLPTERQVQNRLAAAAQAGEARRRAAAAAKATACAADVLGRAQGKQPGAGGTRPSPAAGQQRKRPASAIAAPLVVVPQAPVQPAEVAGSLSAEAAQAWEAPPAHVGPELVGCRVAVWWEDDAMFYQGCVSAYDAHKHTVQYDDGTVETLALSQERWRVPPRPTPAPAQQLPRLALPAPPTDSTAAAGPLVNRSRGAQPAQQGAAQRKSLRPSSGRSLVGKRVRVRQPDGRVRCGLLVSCCRGAVRKGPAHAVEGAGGMKDSGMQLPQAEMQQRHKVDHAKITYVICYDDAHGEEDMVALPRQTWDKTWWVVPAAGWEKARKTVHPAAGAAQQSAADWSGRPRANPVSSNLWQGAEPLRGAGDGVSPLRQPLAETAAPSAGRQQLPPKPSLPQHKPGGKVAALCRRRPVGSDRRTKKPDSCSPAQGGAVNSVHTAAPVLALTAADAAAAVAPAEHAKRAASAHMPAFAARSLSPARSGSQPIPSATMPQQAAVQHSGVRRRASDRRMGQHAGLTAHAEQGRTAAQAGVARAEEALQLQQDASVAPDHALEVAACPAVPSTKRPPKRRHSSVGKEALPSKAPRREHSLAATAAVLPSARLTAGGQQDQEALRTATCSAARPALHDSHGQAAQGLHDAAAARPAAPVADPAACPAAEPARILPARTEHMTELSQAVGMPSAPSDPAADAAESSDESQPGPECHPSGSAQQVQRRRPGGAAAANRKGKRLGGAAAAARLRQDFCPHKPSPYKYVSWHKHSQKWYTWQVVNKRMISLGYYTTPEEAAAAYTAATGRQAGPPASIGRTVSRDSLAHSPRRSSGPPGRPHPASTPRGPAAAAAAVGRLEPAHSLASSFGSMYSAYSISPGKSLPAWHEAYAARAERDDGCTSRPTSADVGLGGEEPFWQGNTAFEDEWGLEAPAKRRRGEQSSRRNREALRPLHEAEDEEDDSDPYDLLAACGEDSDFGLVGEARTYRSKRLASRLGPQRMSVVGQALSNKRLRDEMPAPAAKRQRRRQAPLADCSIPAVPAPQPPPPPTAHRATTPPPPERPPAVGGGLFVGSPPLPAQPPMPLPLATRPSVLMRGKTPPLAVLMRKHQPQAAPASPAPSAPRPPQPASLPPAVPAAPVASAPSPRPQLRPAPVEPLAAAAAHQLGFTPAEVDHVLQAEQRRRAQAMRAAVNAMLPPPVQPVAPLWPPPSLQLDSPGLAGGSLGLGLAAEPLGGEPLEPLPLPALFGSSSVELFGATVGCLYSADHLSLEPGNGSSLLGGSSWPAPAEGDAGLMRARPLRPLPAGLPGITLAAAAAAAAAASEWRPAAPPMLALGVGPASPVLPVLPPRVHCQGAGSPRPMSDHATQQMRIAAQNLAWTQTKGRSPRGTRSARRLDVSSSPEPAVAAAHALPVAASLTAGQDTVYVHAGSPRLYQSCQRHG